jgi:hypothetical protein
LICARNPIIGDRTGVTSAAGLQAAVPEGSILGVEDNSVGFEYLARNLLFILVGAAGGEKTLDNDATGVLFVL